MNRGWELGVGEAGESICRKMETTVFEQQFKKEIDMNNYTPRKLKTWEKWTNF